MRNPKATYRPDEAARIMGVDVSTIHRWISDGLISTEDAVTSEVITLAEIQRFIRSGHLHPEEIPYDAKRLCMWHLDPIEVPLPGDLFNAFVHPDVLSDGSVYVVLAWNDPDPPASFSSFDLTHEQARRLGQQLLRVVDPDPEWQWPESWQWRVGPPRIVPTPARPVPAPVPPPAP